MNEEAKLPFNRILEAPAATDASDSDDRGCPVTHEHLPHACAVGNHYRRRALL